MAAPAIDGAKQKTNMKNQNEYPIHVYYKHDGCKYNLGGSSTIVGKSDECLEWFIRSQTHANGKQKVRGYLNFQIGGLSETRINLHGKLQYWGCGRGTLAMVWGDNNIEAKIEDVESVHAIYEPHSDGLDGFCHDIHMLRSFRIEVRHYPKN
tara:strand:- start:18 stop:473 length:456 start_codon:yes stop_codon:yes gene_type:complete